LGKNAGLIHIKPGSATLAHNFRGT